jgi:hypothetical protein
MCNIVFSNGVFSDVSKHKLVKETACWYFTLYISVECLFKTECMKVSAQESVGVCPVCAQNYADYTGVRMCIVICA